MTEEEHDEIVKKLFKLIADVKQDGGCSSYEKMTGLSREMLLSNLQIGVLETDIIYLISRIDELERQRAKDMFMLGEQIGGLTQRILELEQLGKSQTGG